MSRRRIAKWSILYVSAQLLNAQIHLFGANLQNFATPIDDNSFFIGLDRLSYTREARSKVLLITFLFQTCQKYRALGYLILSFRKLLSKYLIAFVILLFWLL